MKTKIIGSRNGIKRNNSVEGETLETKVSRWMNNGEKIEASAELIYTERIKGVMPSYNIKTDRFDHALDVTDKIAKSVTAKREAQMKVVKDEKDGGTESIEATN